MAMHIYRWFPTGVNVYNVSTSTTMSARRQCVRNNVYWFYPYLWRTTNHVGISQIIREQFSD